MWEYDQFLFFLIEKKKKKYVNLGYDVLISDFMDVDVGNVL